MYKEYDLKEVSEEEIYLNELTNSNDWYYLCTNCKLSEEIMEKFIDKLDFDSITMNQKLSEKFIDKYGRNPSEAELYSRLIKHTKDLGMSAKFQGEGFLYINE